MKSNQATPIALMVYNRPDLTKLVMGQLAKAKPPLIYVIADGPKTPNDEKKCNLTRQIALNPSWKCEVVPFVQKSNKGMVFQFKEGLQFIFDKHEKLIFLHDDCYVAPEFYEFSEALLNKYEHNEKIGQINLTNLLTQDSAQFSYFLSKRPLIWGFATWRRVWETYDIQMSKWSDSNQKKILKYYYASNRERKNVKKMFDLHCKNLDPWTFDYQWDFNIMSNFMHSVTPTRNLCYNIGFDRSDSVHTKFKNPFENKILEKTQMFEHPMSVKINEAYDREITKLICPNSFTFWMTKIRLLYSKIKKKVKTNQ